MDERTWVVIDLDKFKRNVRALKGVTPGVKILAAVKADAYGHGARETARTLKEEGIDMLGVASIDEACDLKAIDLPIVILSPTSINNIPKLLAEDFIPTLSYYPFAEELNKSAKMVNKKVKVHIEIDTGLGRTGIPWEEGVDFVLQVLELKNLKLDGIFTHFSEPEKIDSDFTSRQINRFKSVIHGLTKKGIRIPLIHTASTAAILNFPDSYFNMIRPGLILYGLYPSDRCIRRVQVEPILSLYTKVCQLKWVPPGTPISYDRTYVTKKSQRIATLWVGYGDGYPRCLSSKGSVIIRGRRAKVVGKVCMDLTMVDVTHIPEIEVGDKVTLIGKDGSLEITADEVAKLAGTINYEITTGISPRVTRVYVNNGRLSRANL